MAKVKAFAITVFAATFRSAASIINDGVGLAGLGGIAYGSWLIYRPAGFIVAGLFAVAASILRTAGTKP